MSRLNDVNATSGYGVSVDSRSRPSDQPDNKYDIDLGRTLDRVKSIQLGSIQIPDCRYVFDSRSQLQYSEPITVPGNAYVFIEQTVVTFDKTTCQSTSVSSTVAILVPPSLNQVLSYNAGVVTTQFNTGVDFGVKYYPLIGQYLSIVGAQFPQSLMSPVMVPFPPESGPVLAATTVTTTGQLDTAFQYVPGYLDALTTAAGNYDVRHVIPGVAWSYVAAPKPTLVELFVMLNAALAAQTSPTLNVTGSIFTLVSGAPVTVGCPLPHGLHTFDQVVLSGTLPPGVAGTYFITVLSTTTFSLNGSGPFVGIYAGGGVYSSVRQLYTLVEFGFDDSSNTIIARAPTRVVLDTRLSKQTVSMRFVGAPPGAVSLVSYIGVGASRLDPPARASVPDFILRTVAIRPGNYTAPDVVAMMNARMNPLLFVDADPTRRTLNYLLPGGGAPASVVIPSGRYTGQQLSSFLTFYMSQVFSSVDVTFSSGRFTFTQTQGLAFSLVFGGAANAATALRLGFENVNYSGASAYTSVNIAVWGVTTSYPTNTYALTADETQRHFTFDTGDPVSFKTLQGTNTPNVNAVWQPVYECSTTAAGFCWTFVSGDVLFAQAPVNSGTVTNVTLAGGGADAVVTTAAPTNVVTGDTVTVACVNGMTGVNGIWPVAVVDPTSFSLVGSGAGASGTFVAGSGLVYSNTSNGGVGTNTYTVVVQHEWDASGGLGLPCGSTPATVALQPTVSIFGALGAGTADAALGQPLATHPVYLQGAARDVFQLFFGHPDARPCNFGFPSIAWPPSVNALQLFDTSAFPTYSAATKSVPVASSYTSPYCYNLSPPDYIIMVLCNPTGSKDAQTHTFGRSTRPFFAKLYITSPFVQISEQMLHSTFAGFQRVNSVSVEFQNPDGTLVEFNGRPHSYTLLFTLYENASETTCF